MPKLSNPSEIAREALRLLAVRRMSPSPENYRQLYNEIAGIAEDVGNAFPERELKGLLDSLPKENAAQQKLAKRFEQALKGKNWGASARALPNWRSNSAKPRNCPGAN